MPAFAEVAQSRMATAFGAPEIGTVVPKHFVQALGIKELIIAPILSMHRAVGFLAANFDHLPKGIKAVEILQGVALQLGASYENIRL